ncbi:MAG: hypothetical protein J6W62_00325 [Spirochaetia bacterium]|nr:hypothetical protein [Spirochaetia bacterium]
MNEQFFIFSDSERREKRNALKALTSVEAMPLEQVPEIFRNPKDKTPQIIKQRKEWIFSHLQNTFPDSPVGKIIISRSSIHDSLFKGCNRFKAGLYPILDKLIESSILLYINFESADDIQFILGNKYSRSGANGYVGIVIRTDKDGKKYYSHTIYHKISQAATGGTGNQNLTRNLHPAVNNILHEILSVN